MPIDLEPAATRMAELIRTVPGDRLGAPTPCSEATLGDLVDHVGGLTVAFTAAARKDASAGDQGPSADGSRLGPDWRDRIPGDLDALVRAWRDPEAWTGMTRAGGVDLPGEVAGIVVLDELVIHGWDVARAADLPYDVDPADLEALRSFVEPFAGRGAEQAGNGLFGPEVPVPAGAPLFDRILGITGRDPRWRPPR